MFEIFALDIVKRAFLATTLVAPITPLFGIFLILKRYAFFADTIAHIGFLAIALSLFFNINSLLFLIILSILVSLLVEQLRGKQKLPAEASLSFFLYAGVALSVVFITFSGKGTSIVGILFGSITTVTKEDIYLIAAGALTCIGFLVKYFKKLLNLCIDEEIAHASGVNTKLINLIFAVTVAVSISISIKTMGAFLVGALIIIPPLCAMQISKSFSRTVVLSILFSLFSSYLGIPLSFYSGIPFGASVGVILIGLFLVSLISRHLKIKF